MSTPQPSDAGSSWAGWAISSFTNKLAAATGEIQPSGAVTTPDALLTSARQETNLADQLNLRQLYIAKQ
ncbi:hypothetical protein DID88_000947 [Monilinia fructigena]|uniref:Uncharacterized protein n=1 Tax=Monilinia fructigena TaxID=38457 RepID=A0A395J418_9HELO|nr:hypothetical protein DID88_000947 [Monilinia fructigena]